MPGVHFLAASLSVLVAFTLAATVPPPEAGSVEADIKVISRQLISDVRAFASEAKKGMPVKSIFKKALEIQSDASDLIQSLSGEVSECETNLVIKMAAAGIGSHEVLTLLLADDTLGVLNGRLSLSLAFLERVAQQMEDELSLSTNVGPHAAAIVFGANATSSIAQTADEVITPGISATNNIDDDKKTVVRRQSPLSNLFDKNFDLGNGFGVGGKDGLNWHSKTGLSSVAVKPTFKGGLGLNANLDFKSSNGRNRWNVNPYWNPKEGPGVNAQWEHKFREGSSLSVGGKLSPGYVGARLNLKF